MAKLSVEQALLCADAHVRTGEHDSARALYNAVLAAFPKNVRAQQGLARLKAAKSEESGNQAPPKEQIDALITLNNQSRFEDLVAQAEALVDQHPSSFVVWNILAAGQKALGRLAEAEKGFRKATEINPAYASAYNNMGVTLQEQGKLDEAIAAYQRALELKPAYASAYNNMGVTLQEQGKLDEAIAAYQRALELKPDHASAYNNMGSALKDRGKLDEAIAAYHRALELKPDYASAYNNMGNALKDRGKLDEAIAAYQRALELKPDHASAYNNMGSALKDRGKLDEAIAAYHRALELKPDYASAYNNMGNALKDRGKLDEAIAAYQRALELKPDHASAYYNMGNALTDRGKLDEAIAAYHRALALKPDYVIAEAQMLHQRQHICDFTVGEKLKKASSRLGIETKAVMTFSALPWEDDPNHHQLRAMKWTREQYKQSSLALLARPKMRPDRLKIGYLSADFHNHATMYLMAGLLRQHDRSAFEIFAYSYGRSKSGEWRERAESGVDHFFDVPDQSDPNIIDLVRSHHLDIAIDLKGYTQHTRSQLFQYRLAPIQINYLGYPGTMGAEFIDYIIADPIVIPAEQRQFYLEKVIYLPHSYQPNDNERPIAATTTTRSDVGLPEDAFVFCCFNNTYKISQAEFDIWMRLLHKIDGSVLWLLSSNKWAESNLRREAVARGIDPTRLVFAPKLAHSAHLARHKHADVFIDTFNVNAHTTASDALWSGLPVVTKQGKQFAARVAASLLTAVGLPELITETEEQYETRIVELAANPDQLHLVKSTLKENRLRMPLFDTKRYSRNFERGLKQAYDLYFCGKEPEDIVVTEEDIAVTEHEI